MTAITVDGATRRYGNVVALDDVSLDVHPGELVGLLGPNGAGKSTLLSLVSGQRRPDRGTVRLLGGDPRAAATRLGLGVTPQETGLPPTLRTAEVVDFVAGHFPDPVPTGELLEQFGLVETARKQTGALSGGQKRRLAVALSLVGRPRVLLLDEPTTGLDVTARQTLWEAVRAYHADGGTVLLTSHYLEEVEALAQRVVVIDHGVVKADDALATILQRVALRRVVLTCADDLGAWPGVVRSQVPDGGTPARPDAPDGARAGTRQTLYTPDADALVRDLVSSRIDFRDLEIRGASLEEAFAEMVATAQPGGTEHLEGAIR